MSLFLSYLGYFCYIFRMNTDLDAIRHSLAHVLAMALLEKYPETKLAIGPTTENGFYYDVQLPDGASLSPDDVVALQTRMRELIESNIDFVGEEISKEQAQEKFKHSPYKQELIEQYAPEGLTVYSSGNFTDLCRGGHVKNTKEIPVDAFVLTHVAGAYWRGDENNTMLTRIYGVAFESKKELEEYLAKVEEAKERDHKKLGRELDLFIFSELVGSGLPLFTPRGTVMRDIIDTFIWNLRKAHGYERVDIPHITKKALYEKSGHWDKFTDELFKVSTREGHEFVIKPMNCPHHTQIYARRQHSYRELPVRYANTTKVYRDEQTGELGGLTRVRSITQDDAHVFCRADQVEEEISKIWDIIDHFYGAFGFSLSPTISVHDPQRAEDYLGDEALWEKAEQALHTVAKKRGVEVREVVGEASFYGPKIDFIAEDSLTRQWQIATIQLDMNMPERFDLSCVNKQGEKERIIMIHAAIAGSLERFMGIIIEHYAGAFPIWLAPTQVTVLPISDKHVDYAQGLTDAFTKNGIRADIDASDQSLGKKIRGAKTAKVPLYIVVGDNEMKEEKVTPETRDGEKLPTQSTDDFIQWVHEQSPLS